jgi:hypothetical protein
MDSVQQQLGIQDKTKENPENLCFDGRWQDLPYNTELYPTHRQQNLVQVCTRAVRSEDYCLSDFFSK